MVHASWVNAPWPHTLRWGDGDSDAVSPGEPWRSHVYQEAGDYIIAATSDTITNEPAVAVTVRPEVTPQAIVHAITATSVRVTIKGAWPGDVRHGVVWGDHSPPEDLAGDRLTSEHHYGEDVSRPFIVVTDKPARRSITLVAPVGPPEPPPAKGRFGWHSEECLDAAPRRIGSVTGTVMGAGIQPGTRVAVRMNARDDPLYATAGADGVGRFPPASWAARSPKTYSPFRTATVWFPDEPGWGVVWVPYQTRVEDPTRPWQLCPTYTFDLDDPLWITLGVINPRAGTYQIDWGDDSGLEEVLCDGIALAVRHRYFTRHRTWITVVDPVNNSGRRVIAAPTFHDPWVCNPHSAGRTRVGAAMSTNPGDWYTPVHIDWGMDIPPELPHLSHPTTPHDPPRQNVSYGYYRAERGTTVTIRQYAALRPPHDSTLRVPQWTDRGRTRSAPPGVTRHRA